MTKGIVVGMLLLMPAISFAQQTFKIKGTFSDGRTKGRVYAMYTGLDKNNDRRALLDSSDVKDGSFTIAGNTLDYPVQVLLKYSPRQSFMDRSASNVLVFAEATDLKLDIKDSLQTAIVTGSATNNEAKRFVEYIWVPGIQMVDQMGMPPVNGLIVAGKIVTGKVDEEMMGMVRQGTGKGIPMTGAAPSSSVKVPDPGQAKPVSLMQHAPLANAKPGSIPVPQQQTPEEAVMSKRAMIQQAAMEERNNGLLVRKALQKKYIAANPDSYFSLFALKEISGLKMNVEEVEPLYNLLSERLKNTEDGKYFARRIDYEKKNPSPERNILAEMKATIEERNAILRGNFGVGSELPDFTLPNPDGKEIKLSDYRGKYVLVDFWASWCGPCRNENPFVVEAYKSYKKKGFNVLSVSLELEGDRAKWLAAIKKDGLTWTQVVDYGAFKAGIAKAYKIQAIPQNYLLDPSGKVIGVNLRGEALEEKLKTIFQ